jgi:glycine hydroxymethyltransferase
MIFYRKGEKKVGKNTVPYDLEDKINWAVFPALQGGPHEHQIAAISVALKEALAPSFRDYQLQVKKNASTLAQIMADKGYDIVSGGTDLHMFLLDLRSKGIDGARVEKTLDKCLITVNKNTVPGDTKPLVPSGLRIGAPAMTTRGVNETHCKEIAEFIDRGIQLAIQINESDPNNKKRVAQFQTSLEANLDKLAPLRKDVIAFATQFPLPGY